MQRSTAADSATKTATSPMHVTCCTPTCTVGRLAFPSPSTVEPMTKPPANGQAAPLVASGNVAGSMKNRPPRLVLMEDSAMGTAHSWGPESKTSSSRYPSASTCPCSRHASSRAQGFQLDGPAPVAWRMSQEPGLARETRPEPGDGTNGVTMDAAATGEPDRSWMVTVQPLRCSRRACASRPSPWRVLSQDRSLWLVLRVMDDCGVSDLEQVALRPALNRQVNTGCRCPPPAPPPGT
uniref:Uncharacterized protein n=1 Tax=Arundo donax TaxID=35708 RepID=A0A0A9D7Z2_ARUDO